jgi:hypothetical protein
VPTKPPRSTTSLGGHDARAGTVMVGECTGMAGASSISARCAPNLFIADGAATVTATPMVDPVPAPGSYEPRVAAHGPKAAVRPGRLHVPDRAQAPRVACTAGTAGDPGVGDSYAHVCGENDGRPVRASVDAGQHAGDAPAHDVQADTVMLGEWHGDGLDIENRARGELDLFIEIGAATAVATSLVAGCSHSHLWHSLRGPRCGWKVQSETRNDL